MSISTKRLAKELTELKKEGCPAGITLVEADDLATWFLTIEVLGESVFKGEVFSLRFKFSPRYPIEVRLYLDLIWGIVY
jgi:ubiquitin-conjugating enzyme E2 W